MACFGVKVQRTERGWHVPEGVHYHTPGRIKAEGDWSNAAFWLTAGVLSGGIEMTGLTPDSPQGDRAILRILSEMGAQFKVSYGAIRALPSQLHGIDIDARQVPDLVPILCIVAGAASGTTRILNAARLRIKESDRLSAMAQVLSALGVSVTEQPDGLIIKGRGSFTGGCVPCALDHRIVMSTAVAACRACAPVIILDAQAAEKSYPRFYHDYQALGGKLNVL